MAIVTYFWDATTDSVAEEYDGLGNVQATYTRRPGMYGPILSQYRSNSTSYYHCDALGSTRALTDDSEAVTDSYEYDAWGNEMAVAGSTTNQYRWNGMWGYDSSGTLAVVYVRRRTMSNATGTWTSKDDLYPSIVVHPYMYTANRPTYVIDPSGRANLTWRCAAALAIVEASWAATVAACLLTELSGPGEIAICSLEVIIFSNEIYEAIDLCKDSDKAEKKLKQYQKNLDDIKKRFTC